MEKIKDTSLKDFNIINLDEDGSWYSIVNNAIENHEEIMNCILKETRLEQHTIQMFGKEIPIPRLVSWHGDKRAEYTYSGVEQIRKDWTPTLENMRKTVDAYAPRGYKFNSCLINFYRDGQDSISAHSDDEPELGPTFDDVRICSISLGESRIFKLRHKLKKHKDIKLILNGGDILIMGGTMQCHWTHEIPKTKRKIGPRLNLTFRIIKEEK